MILKVEVLFDIVNFVVSCDLFSECPTLVYSRYCGFCVSSGRPNHACLGPGKGGESIEEMNRNVGFIDPIKTQIKGNYVSRATPQIWNC